ncbi:MAG: thermonuclease family protein, partial [Pseudomonadota bacterium]|nr:thermonuclease family protein [Pseudomonadota bacterium]
MINFKIFLLFFLLFFFNIVKAYEYEGIVKKVSDGDTIIVQTNNKNIKIRLLYIDAPEIKQNYGNASKKFLQDLILNKKILVDTKKNDRYGRQLAEIYLYTDD